MPNKTENEKARNREYQKDYYQDNRAEILESRRKKYETDEEYREAMRDRDARNYWFRHRPKELVEREMPEVKFEEVSPKGHLEIKVNNRKDARHGKTIRVAVYGTSALSKFLDRDPQTIRKWLSSGVIPEPAIRGEALPQGHPLRRGRSQRLYTEDEAKAIYEARDLLALPYVRIKDSLFAQNVRESLEDLEQGLEVQPKGKKKRKGGTRLTGRCPSCEKPYVGLGDASEPQFCRSCGFEVELD